MAVEPGGATYEGIKKSLDSDADSRQVYESLQASST
jgi:hypothetical protein